MKLLRLTSTHIALTLLALAGMVWLLITCIGDFLGGTDGDFVFFYEAATFYREKTDLYFQGRQGYLYPPFFAALLSPLSHFSQGVAASIYSVASSFAILAAAFFFAATLVRLMPPKDFGSTQVRWLTLAAAASGILLIFGKVMSVMRLGQSDSFYLLFIAVAFFLSPKFRFWSGVALSAAINIKLTAVLFVFYFLIRRDWKTLMGIASGFLLFSFVPALYSGWEKNLADLSIAYSGIVELVSGELSKYPERYFHPVDWIRSVSFPSTFARYFGVSELSAGVATLLALLAALLGGVAFASYRKQGQNLFRKGNENVGGSLIAAEWIGIIVIFLTFSPQSTTRHFFGTLALAVLMGYQALNGAWRTHTVAMAVSTFLILFSLNFPPGGSENPLTYTWRFHGFCSYGILIAFACQLFIALGQARSSESTAAS
ncbi:MAG: glycosyltransferase family 87 protein [Verrucomicrobiota bacterium]